MRPKTDTARIVAVLLVSLVAVAVLASDACAQRSGPRWRLSRYGRSGAEIWGEAPRVTVPVGKGYEGDYEIGSGVGFGFGLMFGFSDKLGLEGRMLQTAHKSTDGKLWDLDQYFVGLRYTFMYERQIQPYVVLGGARLSAEWNQPEGGISTFERLWGYGAYGTVGVDYVVSSRWILGLRSDYVWMRYTRANVGTAESDLDDPIDGSSIGLSLSLHYRIPIQW
jgi:hypothetical protein